VVSQNPEATYESLEKYARDLNRAGSPFELDPVIGRDKKSGASCNPGAPHQKQSPC